MMPPPPRRAAVVLTVALVGAALWTLRAPPDARRDAAQRALQRGIDALAGTDAMENIGTVWATQQLLRRVPDRRLHDLVERSVAHLARDPGAHLINPSAPPVELPADPTRGLLRFSNYVQAPFGAPRDRAVAFIADFLSTDESGYTLTHQLLALLWSEDLGLDLPAALRGHRARLLARIEAEQSASPPHFTDLYAERVALLLAFGAPAPSQAAPWVDVIVAAQQPDGRWVDAERSSVTYDGQTAPAVHEWTHTSGFSVVALASYLAQR